MEHLQYEKKGTARNLMIQGAMMPSSIPLPHTFLSCGDAA
jgi:hypothetical protein